MALNPYLFIGLFFLTLFFMFFLNIYLCFAIRIIELTAEEKAELDSPELSEKDLPDSELANYLRSTKEVDSLKALMDPSDWE